MILEVRRQNKRSLLYVTVSVLLTIGGPNAMLHSTKLKIN